MNKKYKISVITVSKNSKKFLEENILSLKNQSYRDYEHIIIDGASTDGTQKIIQKYEKDIKYWISEPDQGLYDAMNKGIKKSTGDIIGILNSDDYYYKDALKIVNNYFNKHKNIDFLYGTVLKHKLMHGYYPKKINWTFGFYTTHSVGFFIKKSSQMKIGLYNIKYKYSSDYDLFYRMIVKKKLLGIATKKDELIGRFRPGGLSHKLKYKDFLRENFQIRLDNGQNKYFLYFIFFLRILRNFRLLLK